MTAIATALSYPSKIPSDVPTGQVLVHNTVKPARRQSTRGFRYWLQQGGVGLVVCDCQWAPELSVHYQIRALGSN